MTLADRSEARLNLAMLPVGIALAVISGLAFVAVVGLAIATIVQQGDDWGWYLGWSLLAAAVAVRNLATSLETMSALDVRGTLVTLGWSAGIVLLFPRWWLG
jgi:hypothetical protein